MPTVDVPHLASDLRLVIGHLARRVRAEASLPLGQLGVLGLLDREGAKTTTELAQQQQVRHQSVARTVAQLLEARWIESAPHPTDGRKTELRITAAGRAQLEDERSRRLDWLAHEITEHLDETERRTLREATELLGRVAGLRRE